MKVPVNLLEKYYGEKFMKDKAIGNFYKCGDETSKPHFVTWNPVGTETPDYHQSAYFGELSFE